MRIVASNRIKLIDVPEAKIAKIKSTLTLANPMYWKLKNMGKFVNHIPKEFKYYDETLSKVLTIPRGMFGRIKAYLPDSELETSFISKPIVQNSPPRSLLTLRKEQDEIVTRWRETKPTEGVFDLSTAFGKTILSLQIIKTLGLTATILVPSNIILNQFVEEAKEYFGWDLGIINGDEKSIHDVTVASVASLFHNPELLKLLVEHTSVLFVDECNGFVSDKRVEVIEQFKPSYIYGLSGTPMREDGQTEAIFFYFGNVIEKYEAVMIKPTVEIIQSETFLPVMVNYHEMVDKMVENKSRNILIAGLVIGEILLGRKVLVLTKRIEHYKIIRAMLPKGDVIICADSDDHTLVDRLAALQKNDMDFSCILGTFSLLGTGFNIEKLDTLIIAADLKSQVLTTQSAGRVLRLLKDKTAKIIDIVDGENGIFRTQAFARQKLYRQKGWKMFNKWGDVD